MCNSTNNNKNDNDNNDSNQIVSRSPGPRSGRSSLYYSTLYYIIVDHMITCYIIV